MHLYGNWHLTIATNYISSCTKNHTAHSTNLNIIIIEIREHDSEFAYFIRYANVQWIAAKHFTKLISICCYYYR